MFHQTYIFTDINTHPEAKNRSQQLLAPEIVRALTELFLAVENQAEVCIHVYWCQHNHFCYWLQAWGVSQIMMIETLTKEGLGTWLEKGISNVAFLSLGLGLDNAASHAFIEAKVRVHWFRDPVWMGINVLAEVLCTTSDWEWGSRGGRGGGWSWLQFWWWQFTLIRVSSMLLTIVMLYLTSLSFSLQFWVRGFLWLGS